MYKCKNCGAVFDVPKNEGINGICPRCKQPTYAPAYECEICGVYMLENKRICQDCLDELEDRMYVLFKTVLKKFRSTEIEEGFDIISNAFEKALNDELMSRR